MKTSDRTIRALIGVYRRLPVKPFHDSLNTLFLRYLGSRDDRVVIAELDGLRYRLDLHERIDANLYYRGAHEPRALETVKCLVQPRDLVIDVGANAGYYTLPLSRRVGEDGLVVAFEPTAWAHARLLDNIALNDIRNVRVEKLGVSDRASSRVVSSDEPAFRASWRLGTREKTPGPVATDAVRFVTLDEYVERLSPRRVAFVKVDVDGYELRVVRGAAGVLARDRPPLLIEIGKWTMAELGDDALELAELLWSLGYDFEREDRRVRYESPEALIAAIPSDEAATVLCIPRRGEQ